MPKRKRSENDEARNSDPAERQVKFRAARLEQQFEHGTQLIHRALKTAKGFERQKLGRRQKTARSKKESTERIEAEVQALKTLDLAVTAERHLFKQLVKTKRINESPAFARLKASKSSLETPQNTAEFNVTARLFNSNPVKNVMPGIMSKIKEVLGLDKEPSQTKSKANKADPETKEPMALDNNDADRNGKISRNPDTEVSESGVEDDISMNDVDEVDFAQFNSRIAPSGSESEGEEDDEDEMDFTQFDSRIARSGSESEPEEEEEEEEEKEEDDRLRVPKRQKNSISRELSLSPTPSDASLDPSPPPQPSVKSGKASKEAPTKTTFLPSLMMGGYWSGSESEAEDEVSAVPQPRKNRMGQQARRALWEKKYGSGANHIKKQKESRDKGWDARKGATGADSRGKQGPGKRPAGKTSRQSGPRNTSNGPRAGKIFGTSSNAEPVGQRKPKAATNTAALHPSWEAAKRAKEQKSKASFQGKKIVFD